MPQKKYLVTLSAGERAHLDSLVTSGKRSARTVTRAHILLKADQADGGPRWDDGRIADAFRCGRRTVERVRQRFVEAGLEAALTHKAQDRPSRSPVLDGAAEARLIAVACSAPPEDQAAWTLSLLADRLVELEVVESVSRDTVRRVLKKTRSSRG
jgi:transposase